MEQMTNPHLTRAVAAYDRGELEAARASCREAEAHGAPIPLATALEAAIEACAGKLAAVSERLVVLAGLQALPTAYEIDALGALGLVDEIGALELAPPLGLPDAARSEYLGRLGRAEEGLAIAEAALTAGQKAGDHAVVIRAAIARAAIALAAEDWEAADHAASEGLAMALSAGHPLSAARLHGILGEAALGRGDAGAPEHFAAMKALADAAGARALQAQARFGLAASDPQPGAAEQVAQAQALVRELVAGLAPEAAARVLALPELARIMGGNHLAFGRARRKRSTTGPVGFTPRMMGW